VVWFHADSTAWVVLGDYAALKVDCRNKSGNVNQLGPWDFEVQGRLLTIATIHGRGPTSTALNYTYMILPNITIDRVPTLLNNDFLSPPNVYMLEQLQNDNSSIYLHGSCDSRVRQASVVLFNDTLSGGVYYNCSSLMLSMYVEQAGGYLYSENSTDFTITVAHPTLAQGTLVVSVNRASISTMECMSDNHWGSQMSTRVSITLPGDSNLLGKSMSVTCKKTYVEFND
jgi:hypothetical protein